MVPDIAPGIAASGRTLAGRHVLLVEDEALIAMMLKDALADAGCAVMVVGSGRCALDAAQAPAALRFDALVVNLGLPDMDGAEVVARLRADRPGLPVLVETGSESCPRIPGEPTAVLVKPFDPATLVAAVAELIVQAQRGDANRAPDEAIPDARMRGAGIRPD